MISKVLTDKQISYIFNIVILSRLLYKTQLTFLEHSFCDKIMGTIRRLFKSLVSLSKDILISTFHSPLLYNVTHLFDAQL